MSLYKEIKEKTERYINWLIEKEEFENDVYKLINKTIEDIIKDEVEEYLDNFNIEDYVKRIITNRVDNHIGNAVKYFGLQSFENAVKAEFIHEMGQQVKDKIKISIEAVD